MKAIEQHFQMLLTLESVDGTACELGGRGKGDEGVCMLYKVVLTFKSEEKTQVCGHSNESY